MNKIFLFFFIFLFSFSSCNSNKLRSQNEVEAVLEKNDKELEKMTAAQWEKYDQEMEKFKEDFELKKDEMTKEQRDKANELIGRYSVKRLSGFGEELKETISDFGKQMEGAIKELTDSTEK